MTNQNDPYNFQLLEDDNDVDIASIFGGSAADEPSADPLADLFAAAAPKTEAASAQNTPEPKQNQPAPAPDVIPLPVKQDAKPKEPAPTPQPAVSLFDKAPVFSYGGARENITDPSMTFDELRIKKAEDFPELDDAKTVSWRVRYGVTFKSINNPQKTTILQIKEEIERSKPFLDGLKKSKDKDISCLVTPTVTAKSKGIASYKGVFPTLETARASDKVICLIPSREGQVYEMRKHELGEFIAPKYNLTDFPTIRAGFRPALPRIPSEILEQVISFFRCFMGSRDSSEAMVQVFWDREAQHFQVFVPKQVVTGIHIDAEPLDLLPDDRYLHYADIHSHHTMDAHFSAVDDKDETPTGLYIVIGRLDRFYPEICTRISCGGTFVTIDPSLVLEPMAAEFPHDWISQVRPKPKGGELLCAFPETGQ